jgi:hypothetical protein
MGDAAVAPLSIAAFEIIGCDYGQQIIAVINEAGVAPILFDINRRL